MAEVSLVDDVCQRGHDDYPMGRRRKYKYGKHEVGEKIEMKTIHDLSLFSVYRDGSATAMSAQCHRYLRPVQFRVRQFRCRFVGNDLAIRRFQHFGIHHSVDTNGTILLTEFD